MPLGTGGHGYVVVCMLVLLAYPSTLVSAGWKGQAIIGRTKLPKFRHGGYVAVRMHACMHA